MNEKLYKPNELSGILGVSNETLRHWFAEGKIEGVVSKGGHHRYKCPDISREFKEEKKPYIYARVSSRKQRFDLERQIASLQQTYPKYDVIQDIGSGLNFKRPGLQRLLGLIFGGYVSSIVVAHKDRLCRFGFELFESICQYKGVVLHVHGNQGFPEPSRELADDLMSIITVFTARYYGSRKYSILPKNQDSTVAKTSRPIQSMRRGVKVFLQSNNRLRNQQTLKQRKVLPKREENAP
jgi:putative resolvase